MKLNIEQNYEKYYADLRLHPTDEGFDYYIDNLYKKIDEKIFDI